MTLDIKDDAMFRCHNNRTEVVNQQSVNYVLNILTKKLHELLANIRDQISYIRIYINEVLRAVHEAHLLPYRDNQKWNFATWFCK